MNLIRVRRLVIQLLARRLDIQIFPCPERALGAPSKCSVRIVRLRVSGPVAKQLRRLAVARLHHSQQRFSLHFRRHLDPHHLQQRRQHIHQFHPVLHPLAHPALMRQLDHQRHPDGLIVEKHPMRLFAVRPERFAVIGHDRNRRTLIDAPRFQLVQ